jgi:hypothetical protein
MRTLLAALTLAIVLPASAAVARQAFHLNCSPIIGWRCPACGVTNATESLSGLHAICRRCSATVDWSDIEPANEAALPFADR